MMWNHTETIPTFILFRIALGHYSSEFAFSLADFGNRLNWLPRSFASQQEEYSIENTGVAAKGLLCRITDVLKHPLVHQAL